ncbi:hypothetical protein TraAM80_06652 [Trypanosoma rangeli]|uniref:Uncharacterized protein n=1 Tax=Trypanosoma rangeli TaxID=5698 RepID=A0A3R7M9R7_TRYRA|nr:uncharacterized protein TraAM80_06652 [Trypanosoma rangeli]RNF01990.1 hypothetical protein TraAM80_06652 [Trypanosoma rangeli]|eukprot:RNF01990.1 hypothetical protein TraAM80_06652 [Trypanosoma rangeli]
MSPKLQAKKQRVRVTNRALEARQFSTVRLPRRAEAQVPQVDVERMYDDRGREGGDSGAKRGDGNGGEQASVPSVFDPIPADPLFVVIVKSKYWPPPPLEELQARGEGAISDGFDAYDRREDDSAARKERVKVVRGELNHPRGKPRQNTLVQLDDSEDDGDRDGGG